MKRLIVVDVSNFIFRAFFAIRPLTSPEGTPVNAVYGVLTMFLKILSKYRPTHILMARDTAGGTFRNEMYSEYKANRSEAPEDLIPQFALIKELIQKMELPHAEDDNYEADDIIGSAVTQWKNDFDEILIASGDKDLMQFVGGNIKMLDTMKDKIYDESGVFEKMGVKPEQIVDYLSMVGDSSDNIPGMRGIGAKGAAKLLAEYGTLEKCIEEKDTFKGKKLITAFNEHLEEGLLSKKLIEIVKDVDLGKSAEDTKISFYPSDELVAFLESLGFKTIINKLMDLRKAEYDAESVTPMPAGVLSFEHIVANDKKKFEKVIELIESVEGCSFHTEFDSGDIFERKISSCTLSVDGEATYFISFDDKSKLSQCELEELLSAVWGSSDMEVASEHWKRDFFFAQENNFQIKCRAFDVTQVHYILDPGTRHDIISLSKKFFDYDLGARSKKDIYLTEMNLEEKSKFCGERSAIIFKLVNLFKSDLKEKNLSSIYGELDEPMIPILSAMERAGISLDKSQLSEMEKELEETIGNIEAEVFEVTGEEINLNSPKQVGELLFEKLGLPVVKKTKTGNSTDSSVLEALDAKNISPVPGLLLQHRELGKLLSTYIKTLPELVHKKDMRLHTHFNQHVAATGRLSSNNPNLQNIPIRTELGRKVRKAFVAKEGHILLGADYSQVELRLLAHFSEDPTMIKAFNNGEDIHRQTASEIMGVPLSEVTSDERSKAKAVNFGLMYGQSSFGLAGQLKISRKEAKDYITNYFQRFSRVKSYLDTLKERAEETGYAETLSGRKRFLPDINSKNRTVKSMAERVAINSPIQGTAADIIKMAMIDISHKLKEEKLTSKMLLQVHDELIFEVPDDEVDKMKDLVRNSMESVVKLKVPLTVDIGTGLNWYELKD
ncbi:MAG: DNA polymerase I [Bacteriovoracaceae bacterium]|nr:DNA polymerase I [Bacteriovoracaceae bacterium]